MNKHKTIRFFTISIILLLQITLLMLMIRKHFAYDTFIALFSALFVTIAVLLGYKYLDLHHDAYGYEDFSVAIWVPIGAIICHLLYVSTDLGAVLSASLVGVLASFFPNLYKESAYLKKLPSPIYCGVFVGMSSVVIAPSIYFVMLAGMLSGLLFMLSKNIFLGIGGKLGTVAFGGVVITSLIYWLACML
ncbi:hypothetical protein DFR65_10780 [Oceanihabitans sediminis]|uniref:Uncharacterized protein n=1 Tax=Oceanihabitans sediminis TaxID=1812012 RepID=A0A368P5T9_9FLAO|nr:hypothetical protein [Oceanihabitans sediminis]RBP28463.1 hypothetical protein DFR65_10780 [Oceanihabitans sediminis]RCU56661.1 hypothetical protein DU428_12270 [Oceanihabitans sediminis]